MVSYGRRQEKQTKHTTDIRLVNSGTEHFTTKLRFFRVQGPGKRCSRAGPLDVGRPDDSVGRVTVALLCVSMMKSFTGGIGGSVILSGVPRKPWLMLVGSRCWSTAGPGSCMSFAWSGRRSLANRSSEGWRLGRTGGPGAGALVAGALSVRGTFAGTSMVDVWSLGAPIEVRLMVDLDVWERRLGILPIVSAKALERLRKGEEMGAGKGSRRSLYIRRVTDMVEARSIRGDVGAAARRGVCTNNRAASKLRPGMPVGGADVSTWDHVYRDWA